MLGARGRGALLRGCSILAGSARMARVPPKLDHREIRTRLADDPWHAIGLLAIASIEPWQIRLRRS